MRAAAQWWSAREAAASTADPAGLDRLLDVALLVVDLRDGDDATADLAVLRRATCPVVALASTEGARGPFDLVLVDGSADARLLGRDLDSAAGALADAAARSPSAAGVLAQVLRATEALPVADALAVESMAYSLLLGGTEFAAWLGRWPAADAPPRADADPVVVVRDRDVVHVTLNRPHVHNALDAAMRDAVVAALAIATADSALRVVLDGNGPTFCSGGDLREFGSADDLVRAHAVRTTRSVGALLHALADRTEVRVHGSCVGAGVELAAFAGRIVAAPTTTFRLPEVAMGAIPGAGGTVSLPRRIGTARTLLFALSGIALDVDDALRWGLVDAVVQG